MSPVKLISNSIRDRRKLLGLTQKQLADALGKSLRTISSFENKEMEVDHKTATKLAEILRCNPDDIGEDHVVKEKILKPKNYIHDDYFSEDQKQNFIIDEHVIRASEKILSLSLDQIREEKFKECKFEKYKSLISSSYPNSDISKLTKEVLDHLVYENQDIECPANEEHSAVPIENTEDLFIYIDECNYFSIHADIPKNDEDFGHITDLVDAIHEYVALLIQRNRTNVSLMGSFSQKLKYKMISSRSISSLSDSKYKILASRINSKKTYERQNKLISEKHEWLKVFIIHQSNKNFFRPDYFLASIPLDYRTFEEVNSIPKSFEERFLEDERDSEDPFLNI